MKLTTSKDQALNTIKALVHGDSGIGKTTSIGTLPEKRTVVACRERDVIPLRRKDFSVLAIEAWDDVKTLYNLFAHPEKEELKSLLPGVQGKNILVIDSLSKLSELCIQHIVTVDRRVLIKERSGGKRSTPEKVYEEQMQMEDWGLYRTRMNNLLSAFCGLPIHVVMTALSTWSTDKEGGATYRTPNMSGKLAQECAAHFTLVLHMESQGTGENETRVWRTFNDGRILAKDGSATLDPFEPADWTKLFKKILAEEKK